MLISFYHAALCPRCASARKNLKDLLGTRYLKIVTEIDALKHPMRAWQQDIRMIPALQCEGETLSGVLLSRDSISRFLSKHEARQSS